MRQMWVRDEGAAIKLIRRIAFEARTWDYGEEEGCAKQWRREAAFEIVRELIDSDAFSWADVGSTARMVEVFAAEIKEDLRNAEALLVDAAQTHFTWEMLSLSRNTIRALDKAGDLDARDKRFYDQFSELGDERYEAERGASCREVTVARAAFSRARTRVRAAARADAAFRSVGVVVAVVQRQRVEHDEGQCKGLNPEQETEDVPF